MQSYRICRISEQFPPARGGLASGMYALSMAQHAHGHDVTVIAPAAPDDAACDKKTPFTVIRIPSKRINDFGWKTYPVIQGLPKCPDIIHTHGPSAFYFMIRSKTSTIPLVHTVHAVRRYQYKNYYRYLKKHKQTGYPSPLRFSCFSPSVLREYFFEQYICKRATHITPVADYFSTLLTQYYHIPPEKMTIVYNGSSFNSGAESPRAYEPNNGPLEKSILYTGRFDWHKRLDLLIGAFHILVQEIPRIKLILVGDGPMRDHLVRQVKHRNLTQKVLFPGWVSSNSIIEYYRRADCFCLPSISEGLAKVLLEAMSMGVPVISADNPAAQDILSKGKYGFLVQGETARAWSSVIETVLAGGPDVADKTRRSETLLNSMYRWEHVAERTDAAYEAALKTRRRQVSI